MDHLRRPCVLVFAGADPSGGAGITADIQAIAANGAHPLTVITALTVQDNDRVFAVQPVSAELLRQQAEALIAKIGIAAVKIGIVGNRANAAAIADLIGALRQVNPSLPVVLDPVLASGHGDTLTTDDAVQAIAPLLPLATLITPNLPEAAKLCGAGLTQQAQARALLQCGCGNVLIKGGHGSDDIVRNHWYADGVGFDGTNSAKSANSWQWRRLPGSFHGSGCTLASAIAARLACGESMADAIAAAQDYCHHALATSYSIADGQRMPDRSATFITQEHR
ncbi:hydroxymethylpyrimidine/phosphomethylpyrimidine kinase [Undibacterium arcticum]|uniref:hydroxymethylpyrimidine kinase n=1 Tax=Undibacterium arcticum TaxID=1762892 RepID=A0ABV7F7M6_9BURK